MSHIRATHQLVMKCKSKSPDLNNVLQPFILKLEIIIVITFGIQHCNPIEIGYHITFPIPAHAKGKTP